MSLSTSPHTSPAGGDSELKIAFQRARAESNIDLILPAFLRARLAKVVRSGPGDLPPAVYIVRAPAPGGGRRERFCVTCSEDPATLAAIPHLEVEWTDGRALLGSLQPGWEVMIVYADGGDYLTQEQLDWFRGLLANSQA